MTNHDLLLYPEDDRRKQNQQYLNKPYTALQQLHNNEDITIFRSDKGKNILILNTSNHLNKAKTLLSDKQTYQEINKKLLK